MNGPEEFRRGWLVVLASGVGIALGLSPIPFYEISLVAPQLAKEFGWAVVTVGAAVMFVVSLALLFLGRYRYPPRAAEFRSAATCGRGGRDRGMTVTLVFPAAERPPDADFPGDFGISCRMPLTSKAIPSSVVACGIALLTMAGAPAHPAAAQAGATESPARAAATVTAIDAPAGLRFSYVAGANGVPLSVVEAGDAKAPGILFIHGLGQSHLSFTYQLHGALSSRFHLVAFDLRGHGNSGKPWDAAAYSDSRVWADDLAKVMAATGLKRPLIVAWSYGTLVTADYIRHYGTDDFSGIVMIGALGGLASLPPSAFDPLVTTMMKQLRDLGASPGLENSLIASHAIMPLLTARPMTPEWTAISETTNALVPPFARSAMSARIGSNNADLIPRARVPMLLLAGGEDKGTPASLMQALSQALPLHAEVKVYEGSGHSPFAEEPERFNGDLEAFARQVFAPH